MKKLLLQRSHAWINTGQFVLGLAVDALSSTITRTTERCRVSTNNVLDNLISMCPCTKCVKSRKEAVDVVSACVRRTRQQVMKESKSSE